MSPGRPGGRGRRRLRRHRQLGRAGDEPGATEVAVAVRYQGCGIGRLLVDALRPIAVRAGLTTLVYLFAPTNRPALRLLRSLDVELSLRDGLVEGRQRLPHRLLVTVSTARGSHQAEAFGGKVPPRGGSATRVLTAPLDLPVGSLGSWPPRQRVLTNRRTA